MSVFSNFQSEWTTEKTRKEKAFEWLASLKILKIWSEYMYSFYRTRAAHLKNTKEAPKNDKDWIVMFISRRMIGFCCDGTVVLVVDPFFRKLFRLSTWSFHLFPGWLFLFIWLDTVLYYKSFIWCLNMNMKNNCSLWFC